MTAKEMFEKLGYKERWNNDYIIEYKKFNDFIHFNKKYKEYTSYYEHHEGCFSIIITLDEHKAIHQQLKELGWLDDERN